MITRSRSVGTPSAKKRGSIITRSYETKQKNTVILPKDCRFTILYDKIGKRNVNFGQYKNKKWKYSDILRKDEQYCRIVVGRNYNVPDDFKKYCCFKLLCDYTNSC